MSEEEIRFFNQPEDFWRGRGKYVFAGFGFIAFEGLLIAWLFRLLLRQKTLQAEARQAVRRFRALFDVITSYSIHYTKLYESWYEGYPSNVDFAKYFGMNAYFPRLASHGIVTEDALIDIV